MRSYDGFKVAVWAAIVATCLAFWALVALGAKVIWDLIREGAG